MSMFLGWGQGNGGGFMTAGFIMPNDIRLHCSDYQIIGTETGTVGPVAPFADAALWPRSKLMGGDPSVPLCMSFSEDVITSGRYQQPRAQEGGGQQQRKIVGSTKDSSGNPLGNSVVKAFVTATDLLVCLTTSDTAGWFELVTPFPATNHYLVAYKAAGPDVAGTTVKTIQPT